MMKINRIYDLINIEIKNIININCILLNKKKWSKKKKNKIHKSNQGSVMYDTLQFINPFYIF